MAQPGRLAGVQHGGAALDHATQARQDCPAGAPPGNGILTLNGELIPTMGEMGLYGHYILRLVLAVVLGGIIGVERELRDKPAGLRTMILICVGAAVFSIVSEAFRPPLGESGTRIAAQIVTGIGFLGAGAILRERHYIFGLTTAASIWTVAAVGVAVGFGMYALAVFSTAAIMFALLAFYELQKWFDSLRDVQEYHFSVLNGDDVLDNVVQMFQNARLRIVYRTWHEEESLLVFFIRAMGRKADHEQLRTYLTRSKEHTLKPPTQG